MVRRYIDIVSPLHEVTLDTTGFNPTQTADLLDAMRLRYERRREHNTFIETHNGIDYWDHRVAAFRTRAIYATKDGQVVGCLSMRPIRPTLRTWFEVQMLMVDPSFRGQGIAEHLYRTALELGITLMSDWSHSDGAAAIWRKLGSDPRYILAMKSGDAPMRRVTSTDPAYDDHSQTRLFLRKR